MFPRSVWVSMTLAAAVAPATATAGEGERVAVVAGGPKDAGKRAAVVASIDAVVGRDLAVCLRAERPATVRLELTLAADGSVSKASQLTDGAVAQCVAGVLAAQTLARTGAACSITVDIALAAEPESLAQAIDRQLAAARPTLAACQRKDAKVAGAIDLVLPIGKDGAIGAVIIATSSVGKAIEGCLRDALGGLTLALPEAKAVKYSLHLDFAGGGAEKGTGTGTGTARVALGAGSTVDGALTAGAIEAALAPAHEAWLACYTKQLASTPKLTGTIVVRFTVRPDGTVKNLKLKDSSVGKKAFEACVVDAARGLSFPTSDGETKVVLPLAFGQGSP